ncbi:MAG: dihydrolipoamide acetyltransferase family protein, partial [Pseudonocardiaceae bacterium]
NQIIVEIETAKAAVELPSPYAGVVRELYAEPGATVAVGTPIIAIDTGSDPDSSDSGSPALPVDSVESVTSSETAIGEARPDGRITTLVGYGPRPESVRRRPRTAHPRGAGSAPPPDPASGPEQVPERIPLTKPPVRKLAKELGIDLHTVSGSGTDGTITREDVLRAVSDPEPGGNGASRSGPDPGSGVGPGSEAGQRREPVRGVRKATAAAVVASAFTAPHVTMFLTVDVTPMMELRARLKEQPRFRGLKLTPLAFAARAVCLAVRRTAEVNASWDEETGEIVYFEYVHLGIATATPRGLLVPKIHHADRMPLHELAVALGELTGAARDGRTAPADMLDGTITITNIGVLGIDTGTPLLNPGESAILALGAIRDMPWVVDGHVVARQVCQLALSVDHRVVDGEQGSRFLADVGALLSDPALAMTF